MNCKKCNGILLTVKANCYDNITVSVDNPYFNIDMLPNNQIGLEYDYKTLTIKYCANCGTIHGNFPIVFPVPEVAEVTVDPTVAEYIQAFYDSTINDDIKTAERILKWLSVRISSVDHDALATLATNYIGIRNIQSTYPEFDEAVEWMVSRYN
jgi:hypothetical protein